MKMETETLIGNKEEKFHLAFSLHACLFPASFVLICLSLLVGIALSGVVIHNYKVASKFETSCDLKNCSLVIENERVKMRTLIFLNGYQLGKYRTQYYKLISSNTSLIIRVNGQVIESDKECSNITQIPCYYRMEGRGFTRIKSSFILNKNPWTKPLYVVGIIYLSCIGMFMLSFVFILIGL